MKRLKLIIATIATLTLIGCGGGGSPQAGNTNQEKANIAFSHIKGYAENGTNPPSVQDYQDAGVVGVNENNLDDINQVIENLDPDEVDEKEEIQAYVDALSNTNCQPSTADIAFKGMVYKEICSPHTNKIWLDRNLGASQVCVSSTDSSCYGDYYQWGRNTDGHEKSTSDRTRTQAVDINNAGAKFIESHTEWASVDASGSERKANWSKTDGTSICPVGFRVPTYDELREETVSASSVGGSTKVADGDTAFTNFLKIPSAGYRYHGGDAAMAEVGTWGGLWSASTSLGKGSDIRFTTTNAFGATGESRATGRTVRCIKE